MVPWAQNEEGQDSESKVRKERLMFSHWIRRFLWWVEYGSRPYPMQQWYERPRQDRKIGEL